MTHRLNVVVDANILIRAVLGIKALSIMENYVADVAFLVPEAAFYEAERGLRQIASARAIELEPLLDTLAAVRDFVDVVVDGVFSPFEDLARDLIGRRDLDDWPYIATALALDCPIWTEDRDYFGTGIATFTSDRVELYLSGAFPTAGQSSARTVDD